MAAPTLVLTLAALQVALLWLAAATEARPGQTVFDSSDPQESARGEQLMPSVAHEGVEVPVELVYEDEDEQGQRRQREAEAGVEARAEARAEVRAEARAGDAAGGEGRRASVKNSKLLSLEVRENDENAKYGLGIQSRNKANADTIQAEAEAEPEEELMKPFVYNIQPLSYYSTETKEQENIINFINKIKEMRENQIKFEAAKKEESKPPVEKEPTQKHEDAVVTEVGEVAVDGPIRRKIQHIQVVIKPMAQDQAQAYAGGLYQYPYQQTAFPYPHPGPQMVPAPYSYQQQADAYQAPPYGYRQQANAYQAPPYGYQQQANAYQAPAYGYQQQVNAYQAPTYGYQQQANAYQAPAYGYQQQANAYQAPAFGYQQQPAPGQGSHQPTVVYLPNIYAKSQNSTQTKGIQDYLQYLNPNYYVSPYFPIVMNNPVEAFYMAMSNVIEYGPEADVCRTKSGRRADEQVELPSSRKFGLGGGGVKKEEGGSWPKFARVKVRRGGVAIAGPGGIATAGSGGTAIVGPGGTAYTTRDGTAVVGPGGRVVHVPRFPLYADGVDGRTEEEEVFTPPEGARTVAEGPVIFFDGTPAEEDDA